MIARGITRPDAIDLGCGSHVPVKWSQWCAFYKYDGRAHERKCATDKAFQMPVIGQTVAGAWEFHGHAGRSLVEQQTIIAGSAGARFGCRHLTGSASKGHILYLRPGAIDDVDKPIFGRQVLRGGHLPDLSRALLIGTEDEFESFVFELFDHVARASMHGAMKSERTDFRVQRIKRFIENHAFGNVTLADIAACVDVSPFTCIRQFKRATGVSPLQYVSRLRLERAKQLLASTHLTITEIAWQVGISDPLYFTRWFSKQLGVSLREFRAIAR